MKNVIKIIIILSLLFCAIIYAEFGTTKSTSVTTTTDPLTNSNGNNTRQSITYTTTTTTTSNTTSSIDDDIVSAIYAKYAKDAALIGTTLKVSSQNGIVKIDGTVTAQSQADEAAIAAKSVPGVKDVRSNIKVTTNPNFNKPVPQAPDY